MKIIDDLLSSLDFSPEVVDVRQGPFQTAVLTSHCGLASTPHNARHSHEVFPVESAGMLIEKGSEALALLAKSPKQYEASIGMATINSLLDIDETNCVKVNAGDLIAEKGKDKNIAIVGHFPFIPKLKKTAKELWVIEKNPRGDDFPEDAAEKFLPAADVIGITGTAFTNHTITHLLDLCNPKAYVVILGDTAPLSPILFNHGIDAISGTKIIDSNKVLLCVSQGATFRQIEGIRLLTLRKEV